MVLPMELKLVLYAMINVMSLYTLHGVLNLFLEYKKNTKISYRLLVWLSYLSISSFPYLLSSNPAINIIIQIVLTMMIGSLYSEKIKRKIIILIFWVVFTVLCEIAVGFTYSLVIGSSVSEIIIDDISKIIGTILSNIIPLMIVKLLQSYKRKQEAVGKFLLFDSLHVIVIPICSIFIIHSLNYIYSQNSTNKEKILVILSLVVVIIINLFFYYLFDRLRETEQIKYRNDLLRAQTEYYIGQEKVFNSIFEKVRMIKHDLNHQLLYIKAKLEENTEKSLDELSKKVNFLIGDVLSEDIKIYSKNQKINLLLNYKLEPARKKSIDLDVKVNVRENAVIDENSLYIILGNAIDNAIQNFNMEQSKESKLTIRIFDDNDNLFIKIVNPYLGCLKFKNGLPVTSKKDRTKHGMGLQNIKKLVDEKGGYLKIGVADNIFTLEIFLYDEIKNL